MTDSATNKIRKIMFIDHHIIKHLDAVFAPFDFKYRGQAIHVLLILLLNEPKSVKQGYFERAERIIRDGKYDFDADKIFTVERHTKKAVQIQVSEKLHDELAPINDNIVIVAALLRSGVMD